MEEKDLFDHFRKIVEEGDNAGCHRTNKHGGLGYSLGKRMKKLKNSSQICRDQNCSECNFNGCCSLKR